MKYVLKDAIKVTDVLTVTELNFREEIVAGDLRGMKMQAFGDPGVEDFLRIAGRLAAQPDVVISKLSFRDSLGVCNIVAGFMNGGLQTGTEPSPS